MDMIPDGNMWLLYLGLLIGPFVQEDTAVIGAASISVANPEHWVSIFGFILVGLIASDSWKYWLGWAARTQNWARKFAEKDKVAKMGDAVIAHAVKTLLAVRFIPLARVPTYVAAGFFSVPYLKYWLSIAASALIYTSAIFLGFHLLGEIMGEHLKTYMPLVALGIVIALVGSIGFKVWMQRRGKT